MLLWVLVLCRVRTGSGKSQALLQGKGHLAPLRDPQTNRGLFYNMQVKEHNTQWVKTHCSLTESRKPALTRAGPWDHAGTGQDCIAELVSFRAGS